MRNILFIINPAAGSGKAKNIIPLIKEYCDLDSIKYKIKISSRALQITEMVKSELELSEYTDIIAVGGDGTVVEVINAIVGNKINFGLIPAGTGNDLARSLNLSQDLKAALDCIIRGKIEQIDLGEVNGSIFVNSAGVGIDGDIIYDTAKIKKYIQGSIAYLLSTLKSIVTYKPFDVTLIIDGQKIEREAFLIAIGNGQYFGGGMKITPGANLKSGVLEVCLVRKLSKSKFLRIFPSVYKGTHTNVPEVEIFECKEIQINTQGRKLHVSADGNIVSTTPVHIKIANEKLNIIK